MGCSYSFSPSKHARFSVAYCSLPLWDGSGFKRRPVVVDEVVSEGRVAVFPVVSDVDSFLPEAVSLRDWKLYGFSRPSVVLLTPTVVSFSEVLDVGDVISDYDRFNVCAAGSFFSSLDEGRLLTQVLLA